LFLDPDSLSTDPERLESIEKGSMRLVTQALYDFRDAAEEIFRRETDLAQDIAEDVTREALDRMGMSRIDARLYGKMDYKRARYVFNRDYAIRQALFVDSKAEKVAGQTTATLQTSQTSMIINQIRSGQEVNIPGKLPKTIETEKGKCLTTSIFVKYNYDIENNENKLASITVAALPNGFLQERYNPNPRDTIWKAGRNAPSLGEEFRVRLAFDRLKRKTKWRVQIIPMGPEPFIWDD
jgi:hypothetical protein